MRIIIISISQHCAILKEHCQVAVGCASENHQPCYMGEETQAKMR